MGIDWYNAIAIRNGGYRSNAIFIREGVDAEKVFEQELAAMLPNFDRVLDAGCGHGDFTAKMSRFTKSLVGFDNSIEMIKIANTNELQGTNLRFVYATTKEELPFEDNEFDLIYDRRGPTSILNHSRIIRPCGIVFGIHSGALELVRERLHQNGFADIEIREFKDSKIIFPNRNEYIKYISDIPGNPDYSDERLGEELEKKIEENTVNGILQVNEYKFIWKAVKP